MAEEFDPLDDEKPPQAPRGGGGLLDLPLAGDRKPRPAPTTTPPPSWQPRHRRRRRRRRVRPWLAVLLLLVLAAAAWQLWPRGQPAVMEASAGELDFGARRIAAASEPLELRLSNGGERPLRVRRLEVLGEAAGLFGVAAEACTGRRIAAGDACRLAIDYRPRESGTHEAVLRVVARAANSPLELPLRGTGIAPRLRIEPLELEFEPLPVGGRSAGRAVQLESVGDAPVALAELRIEGAAAGDFALERDRCSSRQLDPGRECSVRVAFAPAAEGDRAAVLQLPSDAVDGAAAVTLSGSALPAPRVALAPSRLVFDEQLVGSRSVPRRVMLSNRGAGRLDLGSIRPPGGGFVVAEDRCSGRSLAPGADCHIDMAFAPEAEGEAAARLELPQAGNTGLSWQTELAGTAVAPRLDWSERRFEWGEERVGVTTAPRRLRLGNGGSGTLRIEALRLGGADAGAFALASDGCTGRALDAGSSCDLALSFRAQRLGAHRATLTVAGHGVRGERSAELSGSGVAGRLEASVERLEFGSVRVTQSGSRDLVLSNTGNAELTLQGFSAGGRAPGDFRLAGDCAVGAALAPGETCELVVRFAPQLEGGRLATLEVAHDGVGSPLRLAVSGAALPPPVGELRIDRDRIEFGEVQVGARSGILSLTLSNPGPGPVRLREVVLRGPHAEDFRIVPGSCEGIPYLAAGGRCGVGLRFLPAAGGERRAALVVRHDSPGGETAVALIGYGLGGG